MLKSLTLIRMPEPRWIGLIAIVLAGCNGAQTIQDDAVKAPVEGVPALLQPYAQLLAPGEVISFPLVPVLRSPSDKNLLMNPGFETGADIWTVDGSPEAACSTSEILFAEGIQCLQVLPSEGGSVSISQTVSLNPRTFYALSALVFAPGNSIVAPEAKGANQDATVTGAETAGAMRVWSPIRLVFVTGILSDQIQVGFKCSDVRGNAPILIDQCALYALPTMNLLPSGTMDAAPEEGRMPEWYVNGRGVPPTAEGYKSKLAVELPALQDASSLLVGLFPARAEWQGKEFWVSAVVKSEPDGNGPPPKVTFSSRIKDSDGKLTEVSATCPATGEWCETALRVKMPDQLTGNAEDLPPFWMPRFELPGVSTGKALIDEVVMLALPEGQFDGGLVATDPPQ